MNNFNATSSFGSQCRSFAHNAPNLRRHIERDMTVKDNMKILKEKTKTGS